MGSLSKCSPEGVLGSAPEQADTWSIENTFENKD
jgi:hypothetical protein